jgi:hypothetical protein
MTKDLKQKLAQVTVYLLCVILLWRYGSDLEGTEFSGGWLTGPLLHMKDVGTLLFIAAMLLTFFFPRIAAAITILASLLSLPLYLYFTAPGPFRRVVGGMHSVPLQANFTWNTWAVFGIFILVIAAGVSFRSFLASEERKPQNSA